MTSQQVMLSTLALVMVCLTGCQALEPQGADPLRSPYPQRRLWAVVPFRNESGSQMVNGAELADKLAMQLENAANLDVLAINRTIAAMNVLQIESVQSPSDAMQLLSTLGVDGLIVGTITSFDPYDPPKLGLAIELYSNPRLEAAAQAVDLRELRHASTDVNATATPVRPQRQPVSTVSGYFDANSPEYRDKLLRYSANRGGVKNDPTSQRLYRISMDLYAEFVCYVVSWRLLQQEQLRLQPPVPADPPPTTSAPPSSAASIRAHALP